MLCVASSKDSNHLTCVMLLTWYKINLEFKPWEYILHEAFEDGIPEEITEFFCIRINNKKVLNYSLRVHKSKKYWTSSNK